MRKPLIFSIIPLLILTSCSKQNILLEDKLFLFDTMVNVKLYEGGKSDIQYIGNILRECDKVSDNYLERDVNNVYTLNHTNNEVEVSAALNNMLGLSLRVYNDVTQYFNLLCGSLSKLWKESLQDGVVPDINLIEEEIAKMESSELIAKGNYVYQRTGEAEIDLGGIVKGYALDEVYSYLRGKQYKHYLIDAGNSSILLGEKRTDDGYFTVGIKDLTSAYLKLKNCVVSTSSISTQGVTIDGVTYSHIVDPLTGSAINKHDAVIVVGGTGFLGDALSTAFMLMNLKEIKAFEVSQNVKTIVIKNNNIEYKHPDLEVLYH